MRIVLDPPLPDAFIIFEDIATGRLYCAKTDSEGKASLYLPVGTYNLMVFKEGYKAYSTTVTVDRDLVLPVTLEEVEVGVTLEVSGADPKNPVWTPSEGWTYIFSMEKIENVYAFAFMDKGAIGADTHQIGAKLVEEKEGYVRLPLTAGEYGGFARDISSVYATRVAIAFRINDVSAYISVILVYVEDGSAGVYVGVVTDGNTIKVLDIVTNATVSIPYTTDWLVFVFDYENRKAYLYSPDGGLLTELSLGTKSVTETRYLVAIYGGYASVDVDWVAIKSTIPFSQG